MWQQSNYGSGRLYPAEEVVRSEGAWVAAPHRSPSCDGSAPATSVHRVPFRSSLRVAHVITRFVRGGADENTLLSCNAQAMSGHDVHLVHGAEASSAMVERLHPGVRRHVLSTLIRPFNPRKDVAATVALAGLFRRLAPDVVHTHTSKAGFIGRMAAASVRVPAVIHGVHILPFMNVGRAQYAAYLAAERLVAPFTDSFVNVSEAMREIGIAKGVGRADQHVVVPSGMDVRRFRDAEPLHAGELAAVFGVTPEDARGLALVVMVAALEPRKRVVEFLDVFARIVALRPSVRLAVLGEGDDRGRIESRLAALGLSDRVVLTGFREDVDRWIARAEVCVLASEREGLPRAVVQYMLGARPTVVTALPGVEALVREGETGYLVDIGRLDDMAAPILRLLEDQPLSRSMSSAARQMDLSRWSIEHMAAELDRVYQGVLAGRRVSVAA
jgi:glycosyltransferase involved in cell wall biosynthesis